MHICQELPQFASSGVQMEYSMTQSGSLPLSLFSSSTLYVCTHGNGEVFNCGIWDPMEWIAET